MLYHYCDHVYYFTCVMAWIQKCFVFIVMTTSAHECKQPYDHSMTSNFPQHQYYPDSNPLFRRPTQQYQNDTQLLQKSNERSIRQEPYTRIENGSYKILNYPSISTRRGGIEKSSQDKIVFPGLTSDSYKAPKIPQECKQSGICSNIRDYPTAHVDEIISQGMLNGRLTIDKLYELDTPDIAQRVGPQEQNLELCGSKEEIMYPEGGYDVDGKSAVIVNSKKKPVQGVRVEICKTDKSPCSDMVVFNQGYEGRCKQKFMQRKLWALDDSGKIVEKEFRVPSCCSCIGIQTI